MDGGWGRASVAVLSEEGDRDKARRAGDRDSLLGDDRQRQRQQITTGTNCFSTGGSLRKKEEAQDTSSAVDSDNYSLVAKSGNPNERNRTGIRDGAWDWDWDWNTGGGQKCSPRSDSRYGNIWPPFSLVAMDETHVAVCSAQTRGLLSPPPRTTSVPVIYLQRQFLRVDQCDAPGGREG